MIYVLDTHAIVWFVENDQRLSAGVKAVMRNPANSFIVPTMALVEIKFLHSKGRITTDLAGVYQRFVNSANCTVHPLDDEVVAQVPIGLNIHDAVIVATALVHRDIRQQPTTLITKDSAITSSGLIQTLW